MGGLSAVLGFTQQPPDSRQGMRAPSSELECNQCGNRLKDDKFLHTNPNFACGDTAQVHSAVLGTVLGKSIGSNST